MGERARVVRRGGRLWTVRRVPRAEAVEADFRFWYEGLTAEERVEAVEAALESCLKTRGADGVPRLRRVHRRVECPWRPLPRRLRRTDARKCPAAARGAAHVLRQCRARLYRQGRDRSAMDHPAWRCTGANRPGDVRGPRGRTATLRTARVTQVPAQSARMSSSRLTTTPGRVAR